MVPVTSDRAALVLAATPIGDSRDASPRLVEELAGADVVAAEDTRRLRRLTRTQGPEQVTRWWHEAEPALRLGPPSWGWVAESFRSGAALERDPRLAAYPGPLLFLVPDHDRLVDAGAARALAARMPGAELVRFGREAAHEVLREGPAVRARAFAAIDGFLGRVLP